MRRLPAFPFLLALLLGSLLTACGPQSASTSTPSSTLGTDSAATKVGGMPDSLGGSQPGTAPSPSSAR